ncbi:putative 4-diphosphocytidyl-2-C-methyl-D-erythritol kinase [Endomicrobiia bacterium]|uniref:4-diphosphocytidyl-2-C-methyl-D-erythritol kinase n=1 Tax=Endomicrobium trichonymphae TaxID=1408204 RepID=B1H0G5_ENDTX|nr:4-(cytidine 5'-diphospho)-2-C-methyl-D-erythritol kinase [Candidatus Endomicrobium trichonymphae]GHT05474.1 putative 4-diphosphocytidyl-2-C-methyl-D-erythritol kinase [Endomicrobiia bacterium]BAG13997.1 4-diphosphocytidyl-2-C-methyl-D-erythritol kinase [Candidatus Endomicrobium trichonymphae]BAV59063.1 4-diphosphocytidyl-2-C-methyl-D-erythritol kinase [Candidatus Endomicrobium trichonymphae]GHT13735.1 putative 4-diphosphocytidyl-2-C-methyl-D-erythritol kinase [Endomicrobiia bacterium]GHT170
MKIYLKAPAKINFFLEIKNKRADGYHNLESIMQTVSLYDELSFELTKNTISLECNDKSLYAYKTNIVYKAAMAVKKHYNTDKGVKIYLKKEIPIGSGLGGGSSDAASTLKALAKLWNIKTKKDELEQIATKLGADVPFFLTGGTALCEGIGEIVTPLKSAGKLNIVLVNPGFDVLTADIYKKIKFPLTNQAKIHIIKNLIFNNSFNKKEAFKSCFNRLEEFIFPNYPEILEIKRVLNKLCCASLMSGSGATVFGILDSDAKTEKLKSRLNRCGWKIWFVTTIDTSFHSLFPSTQSQSSGIV